LGQACRGLFEGGTDAEQTRFRNTAMVDEVAMPAEKLMKTMSATNPAAE
jgi:hypothetical protein